jgi:hypothetical protein
MSTGYLPGVEFGRGVTLTPHPLLVPRSFFLGGRRGTRTPKHFVNLTGESKNFKMLALNKLQILSLTAFIFSDLNYKVVIFLSQTEGTPKHFFSRKSTE